MFVLKKLLGLLIVPPLAPLLLIAIGLLLVRRRPRLGNTLAWLGVGMGLVVVTPQFADALLDGLESAPPIQAEQLRQVQAIVILAGGARTNAPEYGGQTVNRTTLERARYGARLARQSGLPVLLSGGAPSGSQPEAELMKTVLEEDFQVPVKWVEKRSLDTRDNARLSAEILLPQGIRRVALVTHAAHMPRSMEAFQLAGLEPVAAPTAHLQRAPVPDEAIPQLPNMNSIYASTYALHEWLGLWAYRLSR